VKPPILKSCGTCEHFQRCRSHMVLAVQPHDPACDKHAKKQQPAAVKVGAR